jgi:hypothetical protein
MFSGRKKKENDKPHSHIIAREMNTHGNQMVEDVYDLTSVPYDYSSQQLPFLISTMIITTLNDTKKTPLHDVIA